MDLSSRLRGRFAPVVGFMRPVPSFAGSAAPARLSRRRDVVAPRLGEGVAAVDGGAWKQRPLPLGISQNCAFRASVTGALDAAGLAWIDVVAAEDVIAAEAMTAADLCINAQLESFEGPGLAPVDHGGQLPELPDHSIVLYCTDVSRNPIAQQLTEYLLHASH